MSRLRFRIVMLSLTCGVVVLGGCRSTESPAPKPVSASAPPKAAPAPEPNEAPAPHPTPVADEDTDRVPSRVFETTTSAPESVPPPVDDTARVVVDRLRTAQATRLTVTNGGRFAAVELGSSRVQLFDAARGRLVLERRLQIPPSSRIDDAGSAGFGPVTRLCRGSAISPDGRRALVRGGGRVVALSLATGDLEVEYSRDDGPSGRCSFSGDGLNVLVGSPTAVTVYDARSAKVKRTVPIVGLDRLAYVTSDGGGRTIYAAGTKGGEHLALVHGGQGGDVWRALSGFDGRWPLVATASGRLVASPTGSATTVWDAWSGSVVKRIDSSTPIRFLSLDSRLALMGSGGVIFADVKTWESTPGIDLSDDLLVADLTSDGTRLLVAEAFSSQQTFSHWNLSDGQARFQRTEPVIRTHGLVYRGRTFVVATESGELVFDASTGRVIPDSRTHTRTDENAVDGVWWSREQRVSRTARDILVTDGQNGTLRWSRRVKGTIVQSAASGDGGFVVTLMADGSTDVRDMSSGEPAPFAELPLATVMTTLPSGSDVLVASANLVTRVSASLDPSSVAVARLKPAVIAVNATGTHVAVGGGRSVSVLSLDPNLSLLCRWRAPAGMTAIAISPDASSIAVTTGTDAEIYNRCGGLRATVVTTLAPDLAAVVVDSTETRFAATHGSAPVRWRRGLARLTGREPEFKSLISAADQDIAL